MAVKVKNTVVNGGLSGGAPEIGKTFNHKAGQNHSIMKRFSKPAFTMTEAQEKVRKMFTKTSQGWSKLTEAERELWNEDSKNWVGTSVYGETKPSGKNLYTGCNVALEMANLPTTEIPLKKANTSVLNGADVVISASNQLVAILSVEVTSGLDAVTISVSKQKTAGTSKNVETSIIATQKLDDDTNIQLNTLYGAKYGSLISGEKIFYVIRQVSQGGNVTIISSGSVIIS